jgi:hypothetical protein
MQYRTKLNIPHSLGQPPDMGVVSPVVSGWYLHIVAVGPLAAEGRIAELM